MSKVSRNYMCWCTHTRHSIHIRTLKFEHCICTCLRKYPFPLRQCIPGRLACLDSFACVVLWPCVLHMFMGTCLCTCAGSCMLRNNDCLLRNISFALVICSCVHHECSGVLRMRLCVLRVRSCVLGVRSCAKARLELLNPNIT